MDLTVKNLVDKVSNINLSKVQNLYERYSYLYDCEMLAKDYDASIKKLYAQAEKKAEKWVEEILAFEKNYKDNFEVLSYMKESKLRDKVLALMTAECESRAKVLDARFQKINALPRGAQLLSEGKQFIADWRAQVSPVYNFVKIATSVAVTTLEKKLGVEAVHLGAEEEITRLKNSQNKGKNSASWCSEVEGLKTKFSDAQLKACRNYAVYFELVDDAVYSRKVIRCSEYALSLSSSWNFEKVYELNANVSSYLADLRLTIDDFDKKWAVRVEEAKKIASIETEKWVNEAAREVDKNKKFALIEKAVKYENIRAMGELGYYYGFGIGTEVDQVKSVYYIKSALDRGLEDGYFCYSLGFKYEHGNGTAKDEKKAFELYKKGVSYAYRGQDCYRSLAYCYYNGVGTSVDKKLAYEYFNKLVTELPHQQKGKEYYYLGLMKETAKEVGVNEREALSWYEKSVQAGYAQAREAEERLRIKWGKIDEILSLITIAEKTPQSLDFEKVIEWDRGELSFSNMRKVYDDNIPDFSKKWHNTVYAARNFAERETEKWVKEANSYTDKTKKFNLMLRAAKAYNKVAMGEVGYYYYNGIGVTQNYNEAYYWVHQAINIYFLADGYFYFMMGEMYQYGRGVAKNETTAFNYYKKGVEFTYRGPSSYTALAYCYLNGTGTTKDERKAYEFFQKALESGYDHSKGDKYYWLGYLTEYSTAVGKKDERSALEFYEKSERESYEEGKKSANRLRRKFEKMELDKKIDACYALAQKGDAQAMFELGEYYYTGRGVTRSYEDALTWFEKSAKKGVAQAIERLGDCYFNGHGVKQNYSKAEKYYNQAAKMTAKKN